MADQNIHFEDLSGGDTGERADVEAILNFSAGEQVKAAVLNRPLENLRGRTEILRSEVEDLKYLMDTNIRWIITGGTNTGSATGHSIPMVINRSPFTRGTFTISDTAIVIQPINTPSGDKKASITYDFVPSSLGHSTLTFASTLYGYEQPFGGFPRGSWQRIQWSEAAYDGLGANHCTVAVEGDPEHILHITVSNGEDGHPFTTVAELHAELDLSAEMIAHGFAPVVASGDETHDINLDDFSAEGLDYPLLGTYDRELHYLTKAEIDSYFNSAGALSDGDTLCITYPFLVDPDSPVTKGGRRQATPTSSTVTPGTPNTEVVAGQLFSSSIHPEWIPMSIPLCKRVGYDLIFIDGTIFRSDEDIGVYFGSSGYTNYYLSSTTAGTSGSTAVGVAEHTHDEPHYSVDVLNLTAGTLQTNLEAMQLLLNNKASLHSNEVLDGLWVYNNTSYLLETVLTTTPILVWRSGTSGTNRPGNAQVGWQTISKYQILHGSEYSYVTLQGGYIIYNSGYKIKAPATGTGNITVTIDSAGSTTGNIGDHNIKGTYRLYNATAAAEYALYPTNWFTTYSSGFISYDSMYTLWGTAFNIIAPLIDVTSAAVLIGPNSEDASSGSAIVTHTAPTLVSLTGVLGVHNHAYFNRVLEGFMISPAAPILISGKTSTGCYNPDTITITPGRAIVAGNIITIPEVRTLSNVATSHFLPYTTLPTDVNYCKWYGVWLRRDGVFRIGPLPFMDSIHAALPAAYSDIPGNTMYMLPVDDGSGHSYVDSGYDRHDYTLVNIVWSYNGKTAGNIRFSGMSHAGGNLWVYHQARNGTYPASTWGVYKDHNFCRGDLSPSGPSADQNVDYVDTDYGKGLPGVPTTLTLTAILNVQVKVTMPNSGSIFALHLLPGGYSQLANSHLTTTYLAPPFNNNPTGSPSIFYTHDVAYTISGDPVYAHTIWGKEFQSMSADGLYAYVSETVVYPYLIPDDGFNVSNEATGLVTYGYNYSLDLNDLVQYSLRTVGFMWDRCSPSGIGF